MKRIISIALIFFAVVLLDQWTKHLIVTRLSAFDTIEVFSFLSIVNVRNTGAAFGVFKGFGSAFFIVISLAAIVFILYLLAQRVYNTVGLSLVLGGAVGNLIDRILYGKVVDFVDVFVGNWHWPAFNVADSALTIGVILIIATSVLKK